MKLIKLGGAICHQPATIAQLAAAWQKRTESWVLVHGGGPQLTSALAREGPPIRVAGLRKTTERGAEIVQETMDDVGRTLTKLLQEAGVNAEHVPATRELFPAAPKDRPAGLGRVGTANGFEAHRISLDNDKLLIITPVGWDAKGPLNLNADEGACVAASALGATELVLATDVPGVLVNGSPVPAMTVHDAKELQEQGIIRGGMIQKTENAAEALRCGVQSVTIGPVDAAWNPRAPRTQILPMVAT
jgi:acetylglutamate kinase